MIRQARFLLVAIATVLTLGATTASIASAAEMTLPEFQKAQEATSTSGASKLTVEGGASFSCTATTGKYSMKTGNKLGTFTLDFTGCTGGGEECHSLGDTAGAELVAGEWHLVLEVKAAEHLWLVLLLLPNDPHLECPGSILKLLLLSGIIPALIVNSKKATKEYELIIEAPNGVQKEASYENNQGEQVSAKLEFSVEGGKRKGAGLSLEKNVLSFTNAEEILN